MSNHHPHLPRAPIVEALLDFRVDADPGLVTDDLKRIQVALGVDAFPQILPQSAISTTLQLGNAEPVVQHADLGFMLRSADQLHAVQAQRAGFSFSRLKPYVDWDQLLSVARVAWDRYVEIAKPRRVTRIAIRTINRIEIPLPSGELRDWLPLVPDIPSALPQTISDLFCRIAMPAQSGDGTMVILTHALEPASHGSTHFGAIVDIDVYREAELSTGESLWNALKPLRELKNNFFFECVTQRTLELFK